MSIINPLTANTVSARDISLSISKQATKTEEERTQFSGATLEISEQAQQMQFNESQLKTPQEIANEVIRINSTIGKSKSRGNLTNSQATELYTQIAKLLV